MKSIATLIFLAVLSISTRAATFTVAATNYTFSPSTLTIQAGDVVNWTFNGTHDVTSGSNCTADGKFSSGTKNTGDTYSFTFSSAGSFPYFCSFHCSVGMVGSITVTSNSGIEMLEASSAALKCFPNPFAASTTISYDLKNNAQVNIMVVDMTGKKVIDIQQSQGRGTHIERLDLGKSRTCFVSPCEA